MTPIFGIKNTVSKRDRENEPIQRPSKVAKIERIYDLIQRPGSDHFQLQKLIKKGANLNEEYLGETPLALALRLEKIEIAELLLKSGASPNIMVKEDLSWVPVRYYAEWMACDTILPYFPADSVSEELVARKLLAHIYSIKGKTKLGDYIVQLEEGYFDFFIPYLQESISKVFKDKDKKPLLRALQNLWKLGSTFYNDPIFLNSLTKSYQSGEVILLPILVKGHFYCLVLYKSYLVICNRGEGNPKDANFFSAYVINPVNITCDLLLWILENQTDYTKIYEELPSRLSSDGCKRKDVICDVIESLSPGPQGVSNCSFANLKAAMKAALLTINLTPETSSNPKYEDLELYQKKGEAIAKQYKDWSYFFRAEQLANYKSQTNAPKDKSLMDKCEIKLNKYINLELEWLMFLSSLSKKS